MPRRRTERGRSQSHDLDRIIDVNHAILRYSLRLESFTRLIIRDYILWSPDLAILFVCKLSTFVRAIESNVL